MNRKFVLFLFFIIYSLACFGQSSTNYLTVSNTTLAFNLNTAAKLEADQTISNAITLSEKTGSKSCSVYVELSSWSYPSSAAPTFSPLYLDFASKTSPTATSVASSTNVNSYSSLLFQQPKSGTLYSFKYNLRMKALGYSNGFTPGHYTYTLLFTMTQP
ncbi:MAG: hypothetical protein JSS96_15025 [Bacteroidetes bacterium]|nr:hypothetical protein [Bacteroidota bacterium]